MGNAIACCQPCRRDSTSTVQHISPKKPKLPDQTYKLRLYVVRTSLQRQKSYELSVCLVGVSVFFLIISC